MRNPLTDAASAGSSHHHAAVIEAEIRAAVDGDKAKGGWVEALEFQAALNLLKVNSSELATAAVTNALQACGLAGYRNDGEFSVARSLRDALSSSIMINNDRILGNVASAALLVEVPALLTE